MAKCPNCNSELGAEAATRGLCPKCGRALESGSGAPRAPGGTVPEATTSFERPFAVPKAGGKVEQQQTMIDPTTSQSLGPRTMSIAPRKLTANSMALITAAWGDAASSATGRTSIKIDSKSSAGLGSSLAVNPRAMRDVQAPGQPVEGADYELLDVIGKGGMGVVYSARQASVDRLVAIKMIRPSVAADVQRRGKFLSEAVVTGDLDHPNIVPIYELGTNEQNALFYSMKRVQGTPWSEVIGRKTLAENLDTLLKVCDAVAFAHANGVIHRDLKPENVMLGDFGEVLLMDWGLALATSSFRHAEFVTAPDSMGGTPAYMAPEMVTGPFELIGPSTDIYLLGGILYEAVTTLRPHRGETAQECLMAAARNEIQLGDQSGELVDIAFRAMSTDPQDRYATVRDFQAAIRDYQAHCDSLVLASRADNELTEARETLDYQSFARAVFGFEEALAMWEGNGRARDGICEARLAYATSAKSKGDYELGISLLDAGDPAHAPLRAELMAAQRERDARQKWLTRFKRIAAALVVLVFGVISVALMLVMQAKDREAAAKEEAIRDKIAAQRSEQAAEAARREETVQKEKAVAAEAKARQEEALARKAEAAAELARREEQTQKEKAIDAENKAKSEEQKALLAKRNEEYAAYVARIGAAAAKIDENAFDTAESLLADCQPQDRQDNLRHWEWGYLQRQCRQGVTFEARGTVNSVAFSPDGKWFVAGGEDGLAYFWRPGSARAWLTIEHGAAIHGVAIAPGGQLVATAGADGVARAWSVKDGKLLRTLEGHDDRVLGAAFSPKTGRWLLTWSRDKTARIWDTSSGREVAGSPLRGHTWWVWSGAFSADEKQIVTAGQDGKVIVWSFEPAGSEPIKRRKVFLGHQGAVFAAAFSPDGRYVASAGHDKRVLVWQPERVQDMDLKQLVSGEPIAQQPSRAFEGHAAPIRSVAFSFDGQYVLTSGDDNTVRIWEANSGKLRSVLRGHSRPVQSCAFAPRSRQVLSGGRDAQVKLWNLSDYKYAGEQGRALEGHEDAVLSGSFSADGRRVVTAGRDHAARVFDASSGKCLVTLQEGHEFLASRAIYFNRGRWLLTASGDSTVRIWEAARGGQLSSIEGTGRNAAAAVSRDAKWILTGTSVTSRPNQSNGARAAADVAGAVDESQQAIALWELDAEGRAPRPHEFPKGQFGTGHRGMVTAVAISPDSRWLYSGDDTGLGKLWDAATGAERATLKGHTSGVTDACFLPDGSRLLTSSNDGTVAQWDVATGRELPLAMAQADAGRRDAYDVPMTDIDLSPDGKQLLTLSAGARGEARESVIRLWDVGRARLVRELYRGPEAITSVAFAEAGHAALAAGSLSPTASAAQDHSVVRRFDVDSGREIKAPGGDAFLDFKGRYEAVWAALDAPGGGVLTIGGKGAALWDGTNPAKPERVFKPHSGVTAAGFSADGKWIVTASTDHRAKIWNAAGGQAEFQLPAEHAKAITSAEFSPGDSRWIVTASSDGTAAIWDVKGRRLLHVLRHAEKNAQAKALRSATFSPDGKNLLTAGEDGTVRTWETASGQAVGSVELDAGVLCAAYSSDASLVIAGCADGKAMVLDARTLRPLVVYSGHTAAVNCVAFSPDGRRALTGSGDRSVKLWDVAAQEAVVESAKQTRTAARSTGEADARDGIEILTLKHHDQGVTAVAFSPDGRSILTTGLDGTAVIWSADDWNAPRETP